MLILSLIMAFLLESPGFENNGTIPQEYTCNGKNFSPALEWKGAPEEAQGFALIMTDPDAPGGTFTHWVLYNISPDVSSIESGVRRPAITKEGMYQGTNSFHRIGFDGPCPPEGPKHHYIFTLYALKKQVDLKPASTKEDLEAQLHDNVLDKSVLIGIFGR